MTKTNKEQLRVQNDNTIKNELKEFTRQFPVAKTLKFELKPIGKTAEYIKSYNIIEEDTIREEDYQELKKVLDKKYNSKLTEILKEFKFDWSALANAFNLENDSERRDKSEEEKEKVIKSLDEHIKNKSKNMFNEKFLKEVLKDEDVTNKEKELIERFKGFSTYLSAYFKNRENIFLNTGKGASVINRIVNENFPRFLDGVKNYKKLMGNPKLSEKILENIKKHKEFKVDDLGEFFGLENFNNLIHEDGIEQYNTIVGGFTREDGSKIQGLNEIINEYNQKSTGKEKRFMVLYKQPLSPKNSLSWVPDIIKDDKELYDSIGEYLGNISVEFISTLQSKSIYKECVEKNEFKIKIRLLNDISSKVFGDWSYIQNKIKEHLINEKPKGKLSKAEQEKIDKFRKEEKDNDISMVEIEEIMSSDDYEKVVTGLENHLDEMMEKVENNSKEYRKNINEKTQIKGYEENEQYVKKMLESFNDLLRFISFHSLELESEYTAEFDECIEKIKPVNLILNKARNYITKREYIEDKIKLNFNAPTLGSGWSKSKERENLTTILREKTDNKYIYYLGILKKGEKINFEEFVTAGENYYEKMEYYLFPDASKMIPKCSITTKEVKEYFEKTEGEIYELGGNNFTSPIKIDRELYNLYNPNYYDNNGEVYEDKLFTTKFLRNKWVKPELEKIIDENRRKEENDRYKQQEYRESLKKWINFSKEFLEKYKSTSIYDFSHLKKSEEYGALDEFYNDVNKAAYKMDFVNLSKKDIDNLVNEGKLYLFQIYNKDFSEHSRGKENLHTMYFKEIFSEENLENPVHKLSGGAEIFYRKKSDEKSNKDAVVHEKGELLVNKTYLYDEDKKIYKSIPDELYRDICKIVKDKDYTESLNVCIKNWNEENNDEINAEKIEIREAKYEIKKNKRFFEDKYFLHVPVELNFESDNGKNTLNQRILNHLIEKKENKKKIKYLGIDRGERNLISLCLVNSSGKIEYQENINLVESSRCKGVAYMDYNKKLEDKAKKRNEERKNWKSISNIKNLKEGYLSGVVHKIAKIVVEENAVIVMESLSGGFKRNRQKIEKSIYQKFEKMLMNKLSLIVFKDIEQGPGSVREPIQLTKEFKTEIDLIGQNGIIFYINPFWTSQIDPATGFVRNFKEKKNGNKVPAITDESLESLKYVSDEVGFKFQVDFSKLERIFDLKKNVWEIYTLGKKGKKLIYNSSKKIIEAIDITEKLQELFKENGIKYEENQELKEEIKNKGVLRQVDYYFKERTKLRNKNEEGDFILSPVKNKEGQFFDSRKEKEESEEHKLPKDSDLNGAYNIALKGKFKIDKTIEKNEKNSGKINLYKMTDIEWLNDYQKRLYFSEK